jgi:DNA-binding PadR family transcriptional regulator
MASTSTRMLLLGAVQLFEPVNGYQIRRELISWRVDEWAHINPGSIYSGLETLARAGHLERHALLEGSRTVSVYTTTDAGRAEFQRLFAEAVRTHDRGSARGFTTALSLQPLVARDVFVGLLRERLVAVDKVLAEGRSLATSAAAEHLPPHLPALIDLWIAHAETERAWLVARILSVEAGGGVFAGEPSDWAPPADDPGWVMNDERERYRRALGLRD